MPSSGLVAKLSVIGNVSGLAAWQISTPVFGQIQLAVDEAMTQRRDVGEKNADLTVFDVPGASAILGGDPGRMATAFGKATFIEDEDRIERLGVGASGNQGRRRERLADEGAQRIAHGLLIPDGAREQALHAGGIGLASVFSDLPAIFAGDLAEDGVQIEQGMLMDFGTGKVGTQPGMPLAQLLRPLADLCADLARTLRMCYTGKTSWASPFRGTSLCSRIGTASMSHRAEKDTKFFSVPRGIPRKMPCLQSATVVYLDSPACQPR